MTAVRSTLTTLAVELGFGDVAAISQSRRVGQPLAQHGRTECADISRRLRTKPSAASRHRTSRRLYAIQPL
jgi:hypothetical protein